MQATSLALDHLLRAVGDPVADLRAIGPGHPEFYRAQTLPAAAGVLAKSPEALPAIAQAIRTTDAASASSRVRAHLAAAEAWLSGDPVFAAESYAYILRVWPCDLLALRLAQSCYFFAGWHERFSAVVDDAGRWLRISDAFERRLTPGFWAFVDLHAGLAHLAAGKPLRARRIVAAIERCADGNDFAASRVRSVTLPGLQALLASAEGRHQEAAGLCADLQPSLGRAGGSRIQLEVFNSIGREARRLERARRPRSKEQGIPVINVH